MANRKEIYEDDFFREICATKAPGEKSEHNGGGCVKFLKGGVKRGVATGVTANITRQFWATSRGTGAGSSEEIMKTP